MILLSEYHAGFIRLGELYCYAVIFGLRRVVFAAHAVSIASFKANRISLKPQGFNITIASAIISLFAKAKNITKKAKKERASRNYVTVLLSLFCFWSLFLFAFVDDPAAEKVITVEKYCRLTGCGGSLRLGKLYQHPILRE